MGASGGGLVIMFILLESNLLLWNIPDSDDVVTVALG